LTGPGVWQAALFRTRQLTGNYADLAVMAGAVVSACLAVVLR